MLHWKDFWAWVTIDGMDALEFGIETPENENTVLCWIPSELGKRFCVHWTNTSYYHDTVGRVKMDGNRCGGKFIYAHPGTLPKTVDKDGITDGTTIKPFMFSSLELTDDDALLERELHQELGVIQLTIIPIQIAEHDVPPLSFSLPELKLHEREKKAVTQQITLSKAERLPNPGKFAAWKRTGPDVVKFIFKYRPMNVLQANGVAPLPSLPGLKRKASSEPIRLSSPDHTGRADTEEAKIFRQTLIALEDKMGNKRNKRRMKNEIGAMDIIDLTQPESSQVTSIEPKWSSLDPGNKAGNIGKEKKVPGRVKREQSKDISGTFAKQIKNNLRKNVRLGARSGVISEGIIDLTQ